MGIRRAQKWTDTINAARSKTCRKKDKVDEARTSQLLAALLSGNLRLRDLSKNRCLEGSFAIADMLSSRKYRAAKKAVSRVGARCRSLKRRGRAQVQEFEERVLRKAGAAQAKCICGSEKKLLKTQEKAWIQA